MEVSRLSGLSLHSVFMAGPGGEVGGGIQRWPTSSAKGQIVNISGVVGRKLSIAYSSLLFVYFVFYNLLKM